MTTPYSYQLQDVRRIHRMKGRALLGLDMGLGKTLLSLLYAQRHPEIRPIVVVCPASLKWNWEQEAKKHIGMRAEVLSGTKPYNLRRNGVSPQLFIINYDILSFWLDFLQEFQPNLVIIDESHFLGNRSAKRTRAVKLLCKGVPHILALSGTPLTNRPAELWPTLNLLEPTNYPSFWNFAMRYSAPRKTPWGWDVSGSSHLDELHTRLQDLMIRRRKSEVLQELPPKQRTILPLELPDRKEYDLAVSDFLLWLSRKDRTKVKRAAKAETLVKMGYLKRLIGELKLPLALEWIDNFFRQSEEKLIVFAIHKKIIEKLHGRYKKISVVVDGSVVGKRRHLAVYKFQKDPEIKLFIGNIKAAGVGLNLTAASTVAFLEIGWTPGECVQAEDRPHRIGKKSVVSIYYLIAKDTLEEWLIRHIQKKQKVSSKILDGGKIEGDLNVFDLLIQKLQKKG